MTQRSNSKREDRRRFGLKDDERGGKASNCTTWRKNKETRVLAERNPAVVAVGAWIETGEKEQEHPAVRAMITEELHSETRREKEESLRQFQKAVRKRVSERARMCKQQQQQQQLATRGNRVDQQASDSAQHLMTQKIVYQSWPLGAPTVHSQHAYSARAQEVSVVARDKQHSNQLCKVIKQVRQRLAGCQTVYDAKELSELPGGIWKTSTRNDLVRGFQEEEEEIPLAGQHDQPLHLQSHSKTVTLPNDLVFTRKAYPMIPKTDDQAEVKIQRQSRFLMYRRLFMDMEREQVKEHQLHKKQRRRIARIKTQKEQQRQEAERRMEQALQQEENRRDQAERERIILERLRQEEELEEEERQAKAKKTKESTRYIDALRAQIREKLEKEKVELPPLCSCGDSFWDSHPDSCANNCVFYHNPKGYAQALHSVLLSCELNECSTGNRGFRRKFMHVLSHQR